MRRVIRIHYNRHRYYNPQTGIFINQDPIGLVGGLNTYQFAPNMLRGIDPLGLTDDWSWVDPNTLNFSQAYVSENNYADLMRENKWTRQKPLNVMERDGQLVSLDNRRLLAAQQANLAEVPIVIVTEDQDMPGGGKYGKNLDKKLCSSPQGSGLPKVRLPRTGTST